MSLLRTGAVLPRASGILMRGATSAMLARVGGAALRQRRSVHFENSVNNNTPFSYANKRAFTIGYFAVMGTLFSVPFIAVGYQLSKGNGAAH